MRVLKVKVISLPYIFQVLYVWCFTRPRYQASVYRTIGPLVSSCFVCLIDLLLYVHSKHLRLCQDSQFLKHTVPGQASREQFTSI